MPSFNKSLKHKIYSLKKNFQIIGSAHNIKEIKEKEKQGVRYYFFSIFIQKKEIFAWGINEFNLLSKETKKDSCIRWDIKKKLIKLICLKYLDLLE